MIRMLSLCPQTMLRKTCRIKSEIIKVFGVSARRIFCCRGFAATMPRVPA